MQFCSTRDDTQFVSASQAITQGLSADGGLFVPTSWPKVNLSEVLAQPDYPSMASMLVGQFLTDYNSDFLQKATRDTYNEPFNGKAGHLTKAGEDLYALELWHGPTCAFKDYALQLMPKLLVEAKRNLNQQQTTFILVATSGDTGKAALEGYKDIPGVKIAVFYPSNGTSEVQRLQMTTQPGDNLAVYAVKGNFDDTQTGVKQVFSDKTIEKELAQQGIRLSSANSINWGRLVPQIVYYFAAYKQLLEQGTIQLNDPIDFCVPTGNFGDILAGYYAKQMGLPIHKLICASNKNNVLTDFFNTGTYNAQREFFRTTSPSMDILVSSNLERLLYHISGSSSQVKTWMKDLSKNGTYTISQEQLEKLRETFVAGYATDIQAAGEIRTQFEQGGYLCDPHTAIAFKVAKEYRKQTGSGRPMVVLSTASPFKFPGDVLEALGETVPEDEFEAMHALETRTNHSAPLALAELRSLTERFDAQIESVEIADVALGTK